MAEYLQLSQALALIRLRNPPVNAIRLRDQHWSQEAMLKVKTRAPLKRTAAIPSDSEDPSSSDDKNSQIHIRKASCSKLLQENQQYPIFLSNSPFMPLKTILRSVLHSQATLTQFRWVLQVDHMEKMLVTPCPRVSGFLADFLFLQQACIIVLPDRAAGFVRSYLDDSEQRLLASGSPGLGLKTDPGGPSTPVVLVCRRPRF
ncbi:hypothetical protein H920_05382 [Fukomys damarensis]|uniref:Uncharacterized protein n=1 Tax=Fukomys damarensis TaxID=885580 RepID=A0A091DM72_FUKDA|nr:hypothetical protein H920_05382 [Fukomys damarensis]